MATETASRRCRAKETLELTCWRCQWNDEIAADGPKHCPNCGALFAIRLDAGPHQAAQESARCKPLNVSRLKTQAKVVGRQNACGRRIVAHLEADLKLLRFCESYASADYIIARYVASERYPNICADLKRPVHKDAAAAFRDILHYAETSSTFGLNPGGRVHLFPLVEALGAAGISAHFPWALPPLESLIAHRGDLCE